LPASSVANAHIVVVTPVATNASIPTFENSAAVPDPTLEPLHVEEVKKATVEPASLDPKNRGVVLDAGPTGDTEVTIGSEGAIESST
jgi:hypothetical protein